jgi:hypothetical protein
MATSAGWLDWFSQSEIIDLLWVGQKSDYDFDNDNDNDNEGTGHGLDISAVLH